MWKFLCDSATEKECLARQLFGNNQLIGDVREDDTLFLHNGQSETLMGPFQAATDGTMNIVEHAWGGNYPYQVYVTWEDPVFELPVDKATDPEHTEEPVRLPIRGEFQALSEENNETFLNALQSHELSRKIITKR